MPTVAPYIPPKDGPLDSWSQNFSTLITANPMLYGLTSVDAGNIASPVGIYHTDYGIVTSPTTKTAQAVSAKNTAKVNMLAVVRPYAQTIALNPGVSSANKIALGLNPRTSTPSPITPPSSNPVLTLQYLTPGLLTLRYRDSAASPSVKSKPYGVKSLQLFGTHSLTPITDPTLLPQCGTFTKSPLQFNLPSGYTPGLTWYFAAKWQTQKGLQSPWSPIVNFVVS
jgi:hypothetical protein